MTGQINQLSGNKVREQVRTSGREQVTHAMTTGIKRGEFPDGAATVLVLDHFQNLWEQYGQRIPRECNLLFVRDTTTASKAMYENPAIGVVIVQGLSRQTIHPMVDTLTEAGPAGEFALLVWVQKGLQMGEPVYNWLDGYRYTLAFLKTLQRQDFGGLVQVVSRTLKSYEQRELLELKGLRVQYMDKQDFLSGSFTGKVDGFWERIARFEQYERRTGRRLSPHSPAAQLLDRLLVQAVYPHPAEDRLFDRWERELSRWGASYETPGAMAVEMALTWLEAFKLKITSGDPRMIYEHAVQLPEQRLACDCLSDDGSVVEYRWLRCFHALHDEFNLAVWEILDMAGLMEWMRLELELDLAGQNPEHPDFGRHVRREYGEQLREFFQLEGPSEQWTGWRSSRRF